MPQTLTKPVLLDETGQDIVDKLDEIKDAIGTSSEFIPVKIQVSTPPTKTTYRAGETLDLTGMVVNLVASNGATADVTSACTFSPANGATLTSANTAVTISYYYPKDAHTFTASQPISVKELLSISVSTAPTKTAYKAGETLDLTGLVVMASFDGGTVLDVTNDCTYSPADGATLSTSDSTVTISYTSGGVTKTTTQAIAVKELTSLLINQAPDKVNYSDGETLDLTGIIVSAIYSDGSEDYYIQDSCAYSPADGDTLSTSDTAITISYTELGITVTTTQAISVVLPVYGVEWDGTAATVLSRTDGAANFVNPTAAMKTSSGWTTGESDFDTIQPWAGMQIVEDNDAGTLVSIPKFYYKITQDVAKVKIQISPNAATGFSVSPAHMDRGDGQGERDVVYVGRYHCAKNENYKSANGQYPQTGMNRTTARTEIHNLGSDVWQWDFAMRFTIWLLYIVEFADWNSQSVIGYGCYESSGNLSIMGSTDSMTYHTGTTGLQRSDAGATQYRHIEGLWNNGLDFLDGCYYDANGLNIIKNPLSFGESGGITIGRPTDGFPSELTIQNISGAYPVFIPSAANGDGTNYLPDQWQYDNTKPVLCAGAMYSASNMYGLFHIKAVSDTTYGLVYSTRLMKLPANS